MSKLSLTLSSCFLRAFLAETGVESSYQCRLLELAGISADTLTAVNGRVTEVQFSTLYRLIARQTNDEMLNLLSSSVPGGTMKFAGYSMIAAPTVGVALHRHSRLLQMLNREILVTISRTDEFASITLDTSSALMHGKRMGLELALKVFHGTTSWLIGENISLNRVDFSLPAPPYVDDLRTLFPGPIYFDRPTTMLMFDASILDEAVKRTEHDLRTFLSCQPRDWLSEPSATHTIADKVRKCLLRGNVGTMKAPDIAKGLNMSLRTLSRRLEEEGTTIKDTKDTVRRDLALHRLTQTQDAISEIASDLGFADIPSFYRAFRAWTGVPPGAYRQEDGHHYQRKRTNPPQT
ncbi:AraC family transcriptional regulator [Burkholderia anthina]|uniref:AraC family transcriptional regulator n=1 Tax=Burkholderia anthina TaxID=179879 RepID=UPI00158C5F30|nr:AraC family transcriptional regulator [Burkholderia anthina]